MNVDKVRDVLNAIKKIDVDIVEVDNYKTDSDTVIKITILNPINKVQTIKPTILKKK